MSNSETSYLILRSTASKMCHDITERIENEWHDGDSYDKLIWKRDRLKRFKQYVELHRQFNHE